METAADEDVRVLPCTLSSNGAPKNTTPRPSRHDVAYGACLRNHAAALGLRALDGCGEFAPSPSLVSALSCAACGCHRNFHRRSLSPSPPDETHDGLQKKRIRTKFSPEQKRRMREVCEGLGWRMHKDEGVVEECCREVGISRGVFKVWMHNNKHKFSREPSSPRASGGESEEGSSCKDASPTPRERRGVCSSP